MLAIKPIRLRAVLLLLLFTLLFICSNSLITETKADSPEESFKNTPLPFWDIDNENCLTQYGTNTQEILFNYGECLEDFNDISEWKIDADPSTTISTDKGIMSIKADNDGGADFDFVYTNDIDLVGSRRGKIRYRMNTTELYYIRLYSYTISYEVGVINLEINLPLSTSWNIMEFYSSQNIGALRFTIRTGPEVGYSGPVDFEIDYINYWKTYEEDFSDISDWVYYASLGLAGGEYGFGTDGDIGEMWIIAGGLENEQVFYKTDMNYLITSMTRFEIKSKVETTYVTCGSRITGTGLDDWTTSMSNINWQIQNADITDHAGKTITSLLLYVDDTPDNGAIGNYSGYFDYINIWEEGGTLNVSIPVEQFKNHKLEFMLDTDDLENTTKLDFGIFQNDEPMNYEFSLENQTLTQREFTFDYSEYNYLRFTLDLKYSTNYFRLSGYDENNSKLFNNIIYEYVRKTGDNFRISSGNFSGWFHLYYFTGDVDYLTAWTETIIDLDSEIDYSMLSFSSRGDTDLDDHEIIYNRYISNFQFFRTNIYLYTDFSLSISAELGTIIDIQFYHPDGSEYYRANGKLFRTENTFRFELEIYDSASLIHSSAIQGLSAQEAFSTFQFAVWRTQDNRVGSFYTYDEAVFTSEPEGIPRYVTNYTLENFQANITITYFSEDIGSGYRNFESTLEGFELGYGRVEGVAEPHFSTTWWDSIPLLGPIINAFMLIGNAIILAMEFGLSPITIFLDSIFSAIGGIAGMVWVLFESALSDLGISIDALASDVFGFFDSVLTSISDLVDDVYSAIINLNDNFVAWVVDGITDALIPALLAGIEALIDEVFFLWEYQLNLVGTALGWGTVGTFFFDFTDSVVLAVPAWLTFLVGTISFLVSILVWVNMMWAKYGLMFISIGGLFIILDFVGVLLTMDMDLILECVGKYIGVFEKIVTFLFNIISTLLSAIWGILPF